MKVFGKEITDRQARYLLKISNDIYIKGHDMFFDWKNRDFIKQFENLFDQQNYQHNESEMNSRDVEQAVIRILDKGNAKAAFYAACVLEGSLFPNRFFENVIIRRRDYEAQIAYLACFDTEKAQIIADSIAKSGMPHYNLTLIINCPNVKDLSKNIKVVLDYGKIRQQVALAKYVPNVGMEEIRQEVLASNDIRANYLFAKYINSKYITADGCPKSAHPEGKVNYITDFYSQFKQSTRDMMMTEHRQKVKDAKDAKYCFKLALHDKIDDKTGRPASEDFFELQDIVAESYDTEHIAKFAVMIPGADTDRLVDRLEQLGDFESVDYVEQSLLMRDFFAPNQ